jgi:Leucine-rich repeat (LRR) protein
MYDEIQRMKNLETLNLNYNRIEKLPSEIGDLENLEKLGLSNNNLQNLPESISELEKLNTLSIMNNPYLEKLPKNLCERWRKKEIFIYTDKEYEDLCE